MASLNKVLLMGNLTREPELRYTPNTNYAVCEFGLAINNRRRDANGQDKEETCFVDIVVWGNQAQSCSRFLQKGSCVLIEGRLLYEQWTERESQKKRSRLRVTADRVQFISNTRRDGAAPMDGGPDMDPTRQDYASPRPSAAPRGQYQRQQYDQPPQQIYRGGNVPPQAAPVAAPVNVPEQQPAMPDEDPFENVDDIPF